MKLTSIEVRGKKLEVEVDTTGKFSANYNGQTVRADTLEQLKERAVHITRDKIAVPIMEYDDGQLWHGVITGVHATNGSYLVKWDGKPAEQISAWNLNGGEYFQFDEPTQNKYWQLCRDRDAWIAMVEEFEKAHRTDIKAQVEAALNPKPEAVKP